jgi:hypothetical protein
MSPVRPTGLHPPTEGSASPPRQLEDFALLVLDDNGRAQVLAARAGTPVHDNAVGDAGGLVGDFRDRDAVDDIFKFDDAVHFRHDRAGVRVPLGQTRAALDLVAFVDEQARALGELVHGTLVALLVLDDQPTLRPSVMMRPEESVTTLELRSERCLRGWIRRRIHRDLCRAADVEGPHGELRARLADGLGRDDADRLAEVDRVPRARSRP